MKTGPNRLRLVLRGLTSGARGWKPPGKDLMELAGGDLMRASGGGPINYAALHARKMADRRQKPRGTRILIVDDHAEVREIVRGNLEQEGYDCEEASDGTDAVKKAKAFRPNLIVLDLALPKMNGFEVAMVLRRETPKIPIVVMTMYGDMGQAFSKAFGIKAIVDKSEGMTALNQEIRKALRAPV